MTEDQQLQMWRNKGGQIEWRLELAKRQIEEMEKDLAECDKHIKALEEKIRSKGRSNGDE